MSEPRELPYSVGELPPADRERLNRLRARLNAASFIETIRRCSITIETLLDHQDNGGDIVLCKKGVADKAIWFL
jgi:hypothetical protein